MNPKEQERPEPIFLREKLNDSRSMETRKNSETIPRSTSLLLTIMPLEEPVTCIIKIIFSSNEDPGEFLEPMCVTGPLLVCLPSPNIGSRNQVVRAFFRDFLSCGRPEPDVGSVNSGHTLAGSRTARRELAMHRKQFAANMTALLVLASVPAFGAEVKGMIIART